MVGPACAACLPTFSFPVSSLAAYDLCRAPGFVNVLAPELARRAVLGPSQRGLRFTMMFAMFFGAAVMSAIAVWA